jgi:hypothetical protein
MVNEMQNKVESDQAPCDAPNPPDASTDSDSNALLAKFLRCQNKSYIRSAAAGGICLGLIAVMMATTKTFINEHGVELHDFQKPQTMAEIQLLRYGIGMLIVSAITYCIPNPLGVLLIGLGYILAGIQQFQLVLMAMNGVGAMQFFAADAQAKVMNQLPIWVQVPMALVTVTLLVLSGLGCICLCIAYILGPPPVK